LRELVRSVDVVEALGLRSGDLGDVQVHGNSNKTLRERIMYLAGQFISLCQHGSLPGGFR
jgi:hypothetical protein